MKNMAMLDQESLNAIREIIKGELSPIQHTLDVHGKSLANLEQNINDLTTSLDKDFEVLWQMIAAVRIAQAERMGPGVLGFQTTEVSEEWLDLAKSRLQAYREGKADLVSFEDVFKNNS